MNNRRGDLNLFHIFKAVMEERSVGRAANRLGLTQPAVSNALNRLRYVFDDHLFLRTPDGVKPTQKALDLWPKVHQGVDILTATMFPPEFEPGQTTDTFRVAITDALRSDLTVSLGVAFFQAAPRAHLQFHHHTNMTSGLALQNDEIDCAVGMFPRPPSGLNVMPLMTDEYVCVLRKDHPLASENLTLGAFTASSHVLAKPSGIGSDTIDYWLALHNLNRHISLVVAYFADAMRISAVSDLLSCVPVRHLNASAMTELGLVARPLPFETEKILFKLVWHERTERSASHAWLRDLIVAKLAVGAGGPWER